jgi:hypothetical protein
MPAFLTPALVSLRRCAVGSVDEQVPTSTTTTSGSPGITLPIASCGKLSWFPALRTTGLAKTSPVASMKAARVAGSEYRETRRFLTGPS